MTFNDFINSVGLSGSDTTLFEIAATMLLSFALSIIIFWVYKRTYQGVMYSKTFNISLIALSLVTTSVILAVTSNIILSLGMVGALSIVRFRTAIKDPMDVVYMFWAISIGIITGAGLYIMAILTCLIIAIILIIYSKLKIKVEPYLLIVKYTNSDIEDEIFKKLNIAKSTYKIKSKIKTPDYIEMTIEIKAGKADVRIVDLIDMLEGVVNTAMMSYDGEYSA